MKKESHRFALQSSIRKNLLGSERSDDLLNTYIKGGQELIKGEISFNLPRKKPSPSKTSFPSISGGEKWE